MDAARLPFAVMIGPGHRVSYVNAAFCRLAGTRSEEIVGISFSHFLPPGDECLLHMSQVLSSGEALSHAEPIDAKPHPLYWSYEIWPIWKDDPHYESPLGVSILVTESAPFHRRASAMNEALLVSAVRQHELIEEAEMLRKKLEEEIQERQQAEAAIEQVAFYDALTDLPNRRLLMDRLHQALSVCSRTLRGAAILFIDLDRFKTLNDTRGHHVGDLLLQAVARRLTTCVRKCDTVGRLGGDEFVVIIQELSANRGRAKEQAKKVAAKILDSLNEPYLLGRHEHRGTGSVGITTFGSRSDTVEDLMKQADLALYRAKREGGGTIRFYEAEMHAASARRALLEADLRHGIQKGQFLLYYQPQVNSDGQLTGAEALLKWQHPTRGLLSSSEFITFAEECGLIEPIGQWVMEEACIQLMKWSLQQDSAQLKLAINISGREFNHPDFIERLLAIVDLTGADPTKLIIELTERVTFGELDLIRPKMSTLKKRGFSFALDDFGIGFSSLASLQHLPLDQLKIDRAFIEDLRVQGNSGAIVGAMIALGKSLGVAVIAEGVETQEQLDILVTQGCQIYQGFLFGRPGPEEELWLPSSNPSISNDNTLSGRSS
jgi:diguanylate cyclase (GGDEF)-like protein